MMKAAPSDLPPQLGLAWTGIFRLGLSVERQRGDRKSLEPFLAFEAMP